MPYGLYLSAAGANAQNHRLEVLSHNLANINTPGFKPHLAVLKSRHAEAIERGDVQPQTGGLDDQGGGVAIQPTLTQFSQGTLRQTGNRTDFAINDTNSFFVVKRGDSQLLTRAGGFLFNAQGGLVTPNGDSVLSTSGEPVRIVPNLPFEVLDDGTIQQAGERRSLMLAQPRQLGDLSRVGDNLFQSLGPVDNVANDKRAVVSGFIEQSAVQPTGAMMELIEASRAYEANVRLIQTQDQAMGNLIGRVLQQN